MNKYVDETIIGMRMPVTDVKWHKENIDIIYLVCGNFIICTEDKCSDCNTDKRGGDR